MVVHGSVHEISAVLLRNGLAYAPSRHRRNTIAELGVEDVAVARAIHVLGSARRRVVPSDRRLAVATAAFRAIASVWGLSTAVMSGALGVAFWAVGAPAETILAAVAAPVAMLFCVGVHETAHLAAVRVLVGPGRGAVICSARVVAVLHPAVSGYRARLIASAGPVAGASFAVAYLTAFPGDVVSQYTASVLLVVNLFGLIPLSTDGKVLLHGSTTAPPSGKRSA